MKIDKVGKGYIGECFVKYRLSEMGIRAIETNVMFEYDLLTNNNKRLEIKTGVIRQGKKKKSRGGYYYWDFWEFLNQKLNEKYVGQGLKKITNKKRDRQCDFFVCICLNKNLKVERAYIIPKEVIGMRAMIMIGAKGKGMYEEYKNRWDLIEK